VPRRINLLCDRALLGAYAEGQARIDRHIVDKAASEVFDTARVSAPHHPGLGRMPNWGWGLVAGTAALGAAGVATAVLMHRPVGLASAQLAQVPVAAKASAPVAASLPAVVRVAVPVAPVAPSSPSVAALDQKSTNTLPAAWLARKQLSEKKAWLELAQMWSLTLAEGDPCEQALHTQVHCFRSSRGLALIRQLGRPGIMTLNDENGRAVYALLMGLSGQGATLRMGGVTQTVSLGTLNKIWRGDFATFWRAPPGYQQSIVDGNAGPMVEGLATRLAVALGEPVTADKQNYDAALKAKVAAFQQAHGLKPDGIAGPTTFMQLNRATGVDEPHLQTEK
jgi:general secretion pathway protein A